MKRVIFYSGLLCLVVMVAFTMRATHGVLTEILRLGGVL